MPQETEYTQILPTPPGAWHEVTGVIAYSDAFDTWPWNNGELVFNCNAVGAPALVELDFLFQYRRVKGAGSWENALMPGMPNLGFQEAKLTIAIMGAAPWGGGFTFFPMGQEMRVGIAGLAGGGTNSEFAFSKRMTSPS